MSVFFFPPLSYLSFLGLLHQSVDTVFINPALIFMYGILYEEFIFSILELALLAEKNICIRLSSVIKT